MKTRIKIKIVINHSTLSLLLGLFKEAFNSLNINLLIISIVVLNRVDKYQKIINTGVRTGKKKIIKFLPNSLIKGSKDSNKLFIIFMLL